MEMLNSLQEDIRQPENPRSERSEYQYLRGLEYQNHQAEPRGMNNQDHLSRTNDCLLLTGREAVNVGIRYVASRVLGKDFDATKKSEDIKSHQDRNAPPRHKLV